MDTSPVEVAAVPALFTPSDLNVDVNTAMFDLCRACANDYLELPENVLNAYQDRNHSKFDPSLWRSYLSGLMHAIRMSHPITLPRRVRFAYRMVLAAQMRTKAVAS